jgi:hypothetical protein
LILFFIVMGRLRSFGFFLVGRAFGAVRLDWSKNRAAQRAHALHTEERKGAALVGRTWTIRLERFTNRPIRPGLAYEL